MIKLIGTHCYITTELVGDGVLLKCETEDSTDCPKKSPGNFNNQCIAKVY